MNILDDRLIATRSTDTAHIVTEENGTVCGYVDFDPDEIIDHDGDVYYQSPFKTHRYIIHPDGCYRGIRCNPCTVCDNMVPDHVKDKKLDFGIF